MIETVMNVLKSMGYNPVHNKGKKNINFSSHGFENFKQGEKDIIRAIMGKSLREFYYGHDTQYIYYR